MGKPRKDLIIFGTGRIAEAVSYYFNRDSNYRIVAYVVDEEHKTEDLFCGQPVIELSNVLESYPPDQYSVFVAVGYQGVNSLRTSKYNFFEENNYNFVSYKSPHVQGSYGLGKNSIVMDGAVIQPCVTMGNDVFVWGGAMVGHHAVIEDHCWLTGGCLIGGISKIGKSTFVGLGATVGNEIQIGEKCMIGADTLITKSVQDKSVFIAPNTEAHRLNADQFIRMSSCFKI